MPTTLVNIAQANAQPGPFSSLPTPGPVQVPGDCDTMTADLSMPAADNTDTRNSVQWTISVSPDGVSDWHPVMGPIYWQGGTFVNKQGQTVPTLTAIQFGPFAPYRGMFVRADGTIGRAQKLGVVLTSNP